MTDQINGNFMETIGGILNGNDKAEVAKCLYTLITKEWNEKDKEVVGYLFVLLKSEENRVFAKNMLYDISSESDRKKAEKLCLFEKAERINEAGDEWYKSEEVFKYLIAGALEYLNKNCKKNIQYEKWRILAVYISKFCQAYDEEKIQKGVRKSKTTDSDEIDCSGVSVVNKKRGTAKTSYKESNLEKYATKGYGYSGIYKTEKDSKNKKLSPFAFDAGAKSKNVGKTKTGVSGKTAVSNKNKAEKKAAGERTEKTNRVERATVSKPSVQTEQSKLVEKTEHAMQSKPVEKAEPVVQSERVEKVEPVIQQQKPSASEPTTPVFTTIAADMSIENMKYKRYNMGLNYSGKNSLEFEVKKEPVPEPKHNINTTPVPEPKKEVVPEQKIAENENTVIDFRTLLKNRHSEISGKKGWDKIEKVNEALSVGCDVNSPEYKKVFVSCILGSDFVELDDRVAQKLCYVKESGEAGLFLLAPTMMGIKNSAYINSVFDVEKTGDGINVVLYPAVIRQKGIGYELKQRGKFITK